MLQMINLAKSSRTAALLLLLAVAACASPEEKAQGYYEQGTKFLAKQEYAKASIEFKNALQLKKNMVAAWRGMLQVEEHDHNVQAQVGVLQNIVEIDPKDLEAKLKLGHYMLASNALDKALELANA